MAIAALVGCMVISDAEAKRGFSRLSSRPAAPPAGGLVQNKAAVTKQNADAKSFKLMDTKSPKYSKTDKMLQKNIGKSGKTYKSRGAR